MVRTGIIVAASHALLALIGIVSIRLITEFVTPEIFGTANLILSMTALGNQVFIGPATNTVLRFQTHAKDPEKFLESALNNSLRNAGLLSIIACVSICIADLGGTINTIATSVACGSLIYLQAIRNIVVSRIHAEASRDLYACHQLVESTLTLFLTCALLRLCPSVHSIIFGQASAIATSLLLIQKKFPRRYSKGKLDENLSEFKNYLSMYGVSFVLLSVVNWATNMTDRYVLAWMAGPALTGTYIAAFALGSRAITLCNSFTTDIFRPQVFALAVDGSISKLSRPLLFWFGCNLTLCCATLWIIFVFGDQLLDLFLAKSFMQDTKTIILWIGLGYFLYGLNQILEVCIFALNKPNKLLFPMISGTIVTAYFSVLLIPDYGIIGSAISSTTGFAVQLFATAAQLARFLMERRRT